MKTIVLYPGFRPLDGESISKRKTLDNFNTSEGGRKFPSPRRGINF